MQITQDRQPRGPRWEVGRTPVCEEEANTDEQDYHGDQKADVEGNASHLESLDVAVSTKD